MYNQITSILILVFFILLQESSASSLLSSKQALRQRNIRGSLERNVSYQKNEIKTDNPIKQLRQLEESDDAIMFDDVNNQDDNVLEEDDDLTEEDDDDGYYEGNDHNNQEETKIDSTSSPTANPTIPITNAPTPKATTKVTIKVTKVPTISPTIKAKNAPTQVATTIPTKAPVKIDVSRNNNDGKKNKVGIKANQENNNDDGTLPTSNPTKSPTKLSEEDPSDMFNNLPEEEKEYIEHQEKIDEEKTAAKISIGFILLTFTLMVCTAQQMSENPDGVYANVCRLAITVTNLFFRIILYPFRKLFGFSSGGYAHHLVTTQEFRDQYY